MNFLSKRNLLFAIAFIISLISDAQPGWTFTNTGNNHIILIPAEAPVFADGLPLDSGDYIGAFFDSLGYAACGGYIEWTGLVSAIAVWGADQENDGFKAGEKFKWKIWKKKLNKELDAFAEFDGETPGFNYDTYLDNGMSMIYSLKAWYKQLIILHRGWNLISINLVPGDASTDSLFSSINSNLIIAKNKENQINSTNNNVFSLDSLKAMEAYYLKMKEEDTLIIYGNPFNFTSHFSVFDAGLNWFGYPRQEMAGIHEFELVPSSIILDDSGNFYFPTYSYSTLNNFLTGKGFKIFTDQPDSLEFFPDSVSLNFQNEPEYGTHYQQNTPTDNLHLIVFQPNCWDSIPQLNDEIGVFSTNGDLIGSGAFRGNYAFVLIWGSDSLEMNPANYPNQGDNLNFRIWKGFDNVEYQLRIDSCSSNGIFYTPDGISFVQKCSWKVVPPKPGNEFYVSQLDETSEFWVNFYLSESSDVQISVFDLLSKQLLVRNEKNLPIGNQILTLSFDNFTQGIYIFQIVSRNLNLSLKAFYYCNQTN